MTTTDTIVSMALMALPDDQPPTEEKIRDVVQRLADAFGMDDAAREATVRQVMARRLFTADKGFAVAEKHTPWVNARRPEIDPFYWSRFKLMLQKQWSPSVITALDRSTDEILDLMGDPSLKETWKRRGLVVGDVQSGKTATYSALINKAADAGYRFIILLTGTIENLRRQTQERLDSGFVGFDSSELLKRNGKSLHVGVGLLDGRRRATVFTSTEADFVAAAVRHLGLSLDALREPAIVVIKKNTKVLGTLAGWIEDQHPARDKAGLDIPMLLIDDEADNASIDYRDSSDPAKVNAGIRRLLSLFRRTSYVGFTATPFANIFINPDSEHEMLGDDLFPRDYIYALESPSNYFGPRRIFTDDDGSTKHLREITDAGQAFPDKHKASHAVTTLPDSLIEAMCCFLAANAIRDLRGEGTSHRSMLVNVSHFTNVQDQVESLLRIELEKAQTAIRNFGALKPESALRDPWLQAIYTAWNREYSDCGFDWNTVQKELHKAVLPITTKAVNQRTGSRALDYKAYRETGLRVIAVGGNSLSRGLTLEGLTISYFRRNTKMYDTLLQMGRWFGYRPGYEDLCRVWLPQQSIDWYSHISEATDELRTELRRMHFRGRTPKDFGLAVRAHPDSLMVTARNKMRTAQEMTRIVSLSEQSFESVELPYHPEPLQENARSVEIFVNALVRKSGAPVNTTGSLLFRHAERKAVASLLRSFSVPPTEFRFQPGDIADLLDSLDPRVLSDWDVVIPSGRGALVEFSGVTLRSQERSVDLAAPQGPMIVSGGGRRVGSRGVEQEGLSEELVAKAQKQARENADRMAASRKEPPPARLNVSDRYYRAVRERPLLLIHVLDVQPMKDKHWTLPRISGPGVVAIGLSFPNLDANPTASLVKYKINLVKARELYEDQGYLDAGDDFDPAEDQL